MYNTAFGNGSDNVDNVVILFAHRRKTTRTKIECCIKAACRMDGRRVSKKLINKNNNIIITIIIRQSDLLLLLMQIIGQSLRVRRVRGFSYSRTNDDAPTGRVADTD